MYSCVHGRVYRRQTADKRELGTRVEPESHFKLNDDLRENHRGREQSSLESIVIKITKTQKLLVRDKARDRRKEGSQKYRNSKL